MNDPDHYRLPTKVPTALGGQSAEMRLYTIQE
jgi:hypothetical protein